MYFSRWNEPLTQEHIHTHKHIFAHTSLVVAKNANGFYLQ